MVFLSVCMHSCSNVSQCLYAILPSFPIVFMDHCVSVSQCLYKLLRKCFLVFYFYLLFFLWSLALVFLSVCMHCCASVS